MTRSLDDVNRQLADAEEQSTALSARQAELLRQIAELKQVDECHHMSAVSFEQVVRQSKARNLTGLSARVARKDGHDPIIPMQWGPVRYPVDDRQQAAKRPFDHKVIVRPTAFHLAPHLQNATSPAIQDVYAVLATDEERNRLIVADVMAAA